MIIKAYANFEKAGYEATKGTHMSPSFEGFLGCMKIKIFSNVMIQCASDLQGIPCFVPIHCQDFSTRNTVCKIITGGLENILKRAESRRWDGTKRISSKTQDMIDPFLAALYNTYSLSADLTNPYKDCTLPAPSTVKFMIDVMFIPEGENDNCKLEVLLHDDCQVVLFLWKEFKKHGSYVFLRHSKTTWKLDVTNGSKYMLEYHISESKMITDAGELEKSVGWPTHRMSISAMIEDAKVGTRRRSLRLRTYKWIQQIPFQYLKSMDVHLEEADKTGTTLLHILSEMNESKMIKCLLDKIENIDPRDFIGQTPLHKACVMSKFKTAKVLIENGADVNAIDDGGDSPLTLLSSHKKHDLGLLKMLLDLNANRSHKNKKKMRAVDLAITNKSNIDVVKLLRPV